ncbi:Gfo/Idh/MocA family oxidoreductase [Tessaracoccus lubricantis]|uniref:Gfo/Idh/MocA family oxidoreductase n=1 Tax=Tessaracoccus lubricantis TaxID=545543 RepID=A0ABP9EXZ5_9ACTN
MINVAVVGTGGISGAHLEGYLRFPDRCRVVALCNRNVSKAEAVRDSLGLDAEVFSSYEDLLGHDVDLVSICTPPSTHAQMAVDLLDAGKAVLLEKPMAPSLLECDAMLEAQRRSGAVLSVVAQNRFRDDMDLLKHAVDSGLIGPVASVRVESAWWRGLPYYDLNWRGTWASEGGGPTLNHAVHHVDLLLWLMGAPTAVMAMMTNAWHDNSEVEDLSVALLRYERAIAQLTSSVVHHGQRQEIVVQGRDASVAQPWAVAAETAGPGGFPDPDGDPGRVELLEALARGRDPLPHTGHAAQILDVLDAIDEGRAPAVTGEDGRLGLEVITAIYQSAIEQRLVELPIPAESQYYTTAGVLESAPRYFQKTRSVAADEGVVSFHPTRGRN